jgi:hypothetical protein
MTTASSSVLRRSLSGCSKLLLYTGAAVFLVGGKFLYEIRHVNFFTAEVAGILCGVLLMILGAAVGPARKQGLPTDFKVQKIRTVAANAISHLPAQEIAAYFKENPSVAKQLLTESYDKRYSPSTFIAEEGDGYRVGWYSDGYKCEKRFTNLADAATDYLLFSRGRERWSPPEG